MAIVFADNFKTYGGDEANMLNGVWAELGSVTGFNDLVEDPDPNVTGSVLFQDGNNWRARARMVYPGAARAVAGMSVRLWMNSLPSDTSIGTPCILFEDGGGADLGGIRVMPDGSFSVRVIPWSSGDPVLASTAPVISANAWNHIEIKFTAGASGEIEIRVNGLTVLASTGLTWGNTNSVSSVVLMNSGNGNLNNEYSYWKDLIMWDTLGTSNNNFLGTCHVYTLIPDSDDTLTWTPSTGTTGYDLIDETLTLNDADYISAADPPPAPSVFTVSDLPPEIVGVKALLPFVRARKIDGGDGNVQMGLTVNASTDLGTDRPITTAFTYFWDVSELSPDTGFAWTPTEVNNVKLQIDRTV